MSERCVRATSNGRKGKDGPNWCCEADKMQPTEKGIYFFNEPNAAR